MSRSRQSPTPLFLHLEEFPGDGLDEFHVRALPVEQARQEHVETSGAVDGGETARFLRDAPEGDELIDSLVKGDEESEKGKASPVTADGAGQDEGPRKTVLEDLLSDTQASDEKPAVKPAEAPEAPEKVDDSVIRSLLEGKSDGEDVTDPK